MNKLHRKAAGLTVMALVCVLLILSGGKALASGSTLLSYGSWGDEVVTLQESLKSVGFFSGTSTGYYGPVTTESVKKFQRAWGLTVDGIAGPQTLKALYGTSPSSGSSTLRLGSNGSQVTQLQNSLKAKGYFSGKATGYYGPVTQESVRKYQRDVGLTADGIAGPKTLAALSGKSSAASTASRGSTNGQQKSSQADADIYWLARIIEAEAGGESYTGKLAVGNVIMNRVYSPKFPNSVYGVIFQYDQGVPQFSPVPDGTIYNTPSADSMKAAREAYYGAKPVGNALYFFNPAKASAPWIVNNRSYITTIGGHAFYA